MKYNISIEDIYSLEPNLIDGYVYITLNNGKKGRLKLNSDKIDEEYTDLRNLVYGKNYLSFYNGEKRLKIQDMSTNIIYKSIKECAKECNYNYNKFRIKILKEGIYKGIEYKLFYTNE